MEPSDETKRSAVLLSNLQGVSRDEVCTRFGLKRAALVRLRKTVFVDPSRKDLVLARISECGRLSEGALGSLDDIAAYVDWQNHDGTTAPQVQQLLDELVEDGLLALEGERWRLCRPWP